MNQIKIVSMNVRGINEYNKRKKSFAFLKKKCPDVICIQETHCQIEYEELWKNQVGFEIIFSNGTSSSRGVATCIKKSSDIKIVKISKDQQGRILIVDVDLQNVVFTIVNLYAPNEDDPDFFLELFALLQNHKNEEIVMTGDFNLVMQTEIDASNPNRRNNVKALAVLQHFMDEMMLTDCWRMLNPDKRIYYWYRSKPNFQASRLDYFIVNHGLLSKCESSIEPGFATDHSLITLTLHINKVERGRGYWKFNNSLLKDIEFLKHINSEIEDLCASFYHENIDIRWEEIKELLTEEAQSWSRNKAKNNRLNFYKLTEDLKNLKYRIDQQQADISLREELLNIYESKQNEMNKQITYKTLGAIIRSRFKWAAEGEKSSKYFYGLEKIKASNKTIKFLITDSGERISHKDKIMAEQIKYYSKLCSSNKSVQFKYVNQTDIKLSDSDKERLDEPITFEEFSTAVFQMPNNKSPGIDGLSIEVIKVFFKQIGTQLFETIQWCVQHGQLTLSMRRGLLCLIPKKDRDPCRIKNWRPLTLMNSDHKVFTKILANRMKSVLHIIIGTQQTGYMEKRFIGMNIRKLIDSIQYIEDENLGALLMLIDFEKCFDTIEFEAIRGSLRYYNFGEKFINMIMLLYSGFQTAITYNGFVSPYMYPSRGCHQGCSISGYLFLLNAEILSSMIKNDPVGDETLDVVLQFVDDMSVLMMPSESSLNRLIEIMDNFQQNTGLKTNYEKTTIHKLGNLRSQNFRVRTVKQFNWSSSNIYSLGTFMEQNEESLNKSFSETLEKVQTVLKVWKTRSLTLFGKISMLNSLVGSLFTYKMQFLPCISNNNAIKLNCTIENFIWNGRKPKIRMKTLQASKISGGANLFDIQKRDSALKITWIKRLEVMEPSQKLLAYHFIKPKITNADFWQYNFNYKDIDYVCQAKGFWRDVIKSWSEYNFKAPETLADIMNQSIWCNSLIRVDSKPCFLKKTC